MAWFEQLQIPLDTAEWIDDEDERAGSTFVVEVSRKLTWAEIEYLRTTQFPAGNPVEFVGKEEVGFHRHSLLFMSEWDSRNAFELVADTLGEDFVNVFPVNVRTLWDWYRG